MSESPEQIDLFTQCKIDRAKLRYEIPSQDKYIHIPPLPSGFTPMGRIEAEGLMYRGLSSGRVPKWILLVSWFGFGFWMFFNISWIWSGILLNAIDPVAIAFSLSMTILYFSILYRGTKRKIAGKK